MDWYRIRHTLGLMCQSTGFKRADYVKKHQIFRHVGDKCMFMFRKVPLYPKLISCGNNVHIASIVLFITHDVTHNMLNTRVGEKKYREYIGPIDIGDNVFVGSNSTIIYNSRIPSDTIIGANSLVNRKLESGGVYAGVPVRYICSLEEFIKKREDYDLSITKNKTNLSEDTVETCWKNFMDN